jgi:[protein-PII] uridylyltransferase
MNILSAQIFTRTDGIVLDTFCVTDARTGTLVPNENRERFEELLLKALTIEDIDFRALIARQKSARPLYQALEGERIPTRIRFDNEASENQTVLEIETEDRLGLLYVISEVLAELGLDISLAKILTEKGAAIDSFYVSEREHGDEKILDAERQKFIKEKLCAALAGMEK